MKNKDLVDYGFDKVNQKGQRCRVFFNTKEEREVLIPYSKSERKPIARKEAKCLIQ